MASVFVYVFMNRTFTRLFIPRANEVGFMIRINYHLGIQHVYKKE